MIMSMTTFMICILITDIFLEMIHFIQDRAGEAETCIGDIEGDLIDPCDIPLKVQLPLSGLFVLPLAEAGELCWSDIGETLLGEGVLLFGGSTYGVNL